MNAGKTGNKGGVLLGLGLVRDRQGFPRDGLPIVQKAYDFYKDRAAGQLSSLQAKAGISCAKLHMKLGNAAKAEEHCRESAHVYEVTCGKESPLLASACHELGEVLWKQRKRIEAREWLEKAYRLESIKDAFNLTTVLEIHQMLMDTHLKDCDGGVDRSKIGAHQAVVEIAMKRVRGMPQDGNAAVYYKAAAELYSWAGMYTTAVPLFNEAIELLKVETSIDCSGLISACKSMLSFCKRNLQGQQDSPMMLEVENVASNLEVAQGSEVHSSLRNLNAGDFDAVKLIWQKYSTINSPPITTSRRWRDFIEENAATCWGALGEGGALVGIIVCGSDGLHCYLHQFGVDARFNRQTVGAALFDKVKALCSAKALEMEFMVPHALTADITSLLKGIDLSPNPQEAWTA